ncbi:hypothetical protein F4777DRAFT_422923 [Nemania sp. FL0916]|nr:hypothetical protein F4777DRAFT_422923 [Nemania sp. FL0916]
MTSGAASCCSRAISRPQCCRRWKSMRRRQTSNGGTSNALGIKAVSLVWWTMTVGWANAADNRSFNNRISAIPSARNVTFAYIFMSEAHVDRPAPHCVLWRGQCEAAAVCTEGLRPVSRLSKVGFWGPKDTSEVRTFGPQSYVLRSR